MFHEISTPDQVYELGRWRAIALSGPAVSGSGASCSLKPRYYTDHYRPLSSLARRQRPDILTVVDTFSRFSPAVDARFSYKGEYVVQTLERVCRQVGYPATIRVDNGSEFISRDLDLWAYHRGVVLDFSRPGKPTDNGYIESFNGKFRAEWLNAHWFMSLDDARAKMEDWRRDYDEFRPHSAIGTHADLSQNLGKFQLPLAQNRRALPMGQSSLQNELFRRGKVRLNARRMLAQFDSRGAPIAMRDKVKGRTRRDAILKILLSISLMRTTLMRDSVVSSEKVVRMLHLEPGCFYWGRSPKYENDTETIVQISTVFGREKDNWTVAVLGTDQHYMISDFKFLALVQPARTAATLRAA